MNFKKISFGFSVMEIMVAVLAVSIIMAALTPIVSKKLNTKNTSSNPVENLTNSELSSNCNINNCILCDENGNCLACKNECEGNDQYLNTADCTCIQCSEQYTGCKTCNDDHCLTCGDGYTGNDSDHSCTKIEEEL